MRSPWQISVCLGKNREWVVRSGGKARLRKQELHELIDIGRLVQHPPLDAYIAVGCYLMFYN